MLPPVVHLVCVCVCVCVCERERDRETEKERARERACARATRMQLSPSDSKERTTSLSTLESSFAKALAPSRTALVFFDTAFASAIFRASAAVIPLAAPCIPCIPCIRGRYPPFTGVCGEILESQNPGIFTTEGHYTWDFREFLPVETAEGSEWKTSRHQVPPRRLSPPSMFLPQGHHHCPVCAQRPRPCRRAPAAPLRARLRPLDLYTHTRVYTHTYAHICVFTDTDTDSDTDSDRHRNTDTHLYQRPSWDRPCALS